MIGSGAVANQVIYTYTYRLRITGESLIREMLRQKRHLILFHFFFLFFLFKVYYLHFFKYRLKRCGARFLLLICLYGPRRGLAHSTVDCIKKFRDFFFYSENKRKKSFVANYLNIRYNLINQKKHSLNKLI